LISGLFRLVSYPCCRGSLSVYVRARVLASFRIAFAAAVSVAIKFTVRAVSVIFFLPVVRVTYPIFFVGVLHSTRDSGLIQFSAHI